MKNHSIIKVPKVPKRNRSAQRALNQKAGPLASKKDRAKARSRLRWQEERGDQEWLGLTGLYSSW